MEDEPKVETEVVPTATESEPSQEKDPIKEELERLDKKPKRSKLEQLEYTQRRVNDQIADERRKNGIEEDDNRPLTVAEFKALQAQQAQETAVKLSDSIEDDSERKLVQYHLENTIKPSGDAATDLRNARLIVNSVKNNMIVEETLRGMKPKAAGSAASAPPKEKQATDLTADEKAIMLAFKLSEAEVLAARPKE